MAESSTVARWELALRIKRRRDELKMNVADIVSHLGFTRNFFSAVENERALLSAEKLELLMQLMEFPESERKEMRELDRIARIRGWWESELLEDEGVRYLGLEQGASEIRTFESLAVSGLVQTPEYMKAVFDRDPVVGRVQMREIIQIRNKRQESLLLGGTPIMMLVSEAALVQIWGSPAIQVAQLNKMLQLAEETNLEIRVMPFDRSPGPISTSSTLDILDFASPHLPSIIWQEPLRSVDFVQQGDDHYDRLRIAWEEGYENALSPSESKDKITAVAKSLRS